MSTRAHRAGSPPSTSAGCSSLRLVPRAYDHPDARELQQALYRSQRALYGFADDPTDSNPEDFLPPRGAFVIGYDADTAPIACGGWTWHEPHTAEIKRMYVDASHRGHRHGNQVLSGLEVRAWVASANRIILETGVHNIAALELYRANGYHPIPSYMSGRNPSINRALTKSLRDAR
ncbi:GNAT family N-acetyltransferase [Allokutzneria multivorans]|uniref:GNAT family N-acetyltransferase n=1 Tax=Allokutzneria multivorans TaxID=1142134 RepID=A0ABP7SEA1_9PSEU